MLTEDQKAELCQEVAECPAYLGKLEPYEKQALQQYVKNKRAELACLPVDAQVYYRAIAPAYDLADVVVGLLAAEMAEVTPAPNTTPQTPDKGRSRTRPATLRPGLTVEAVKAMFAGLQLTQAGEWATVLAALVASGTLLGDASKVHRWLELYVGPKLTSRKTVAEKLEYREAKDLHNKSESRIFEAVLKSANSNAN
jgi:hypothetical protein